MTQTVITKTFQFSGTVESFTMPAGFSNQVAYTVQGAAGGGGGVDGAGPGGFGSDGVTKTGMLTINAGDLVSVVCGEGGGAGVSGGYGSFARGGRSLVKTLTTGANDWGGGYGGYPGWWSGSGGGGGGASGILIGNAVAVCAGGGGGGGGGANYAQGVDAPVGSIGEVSPGSRVGQNAQGDGAGGGGGGGGVSAGQGGHWAGDRWARGGTGGYVGSDTSAVTFMTWGQPGVTAYTNGAYCDFLNRFGVWESNAGAGSFTRTYTVNFPVSGYYFIEGSCDNYGSVLIDGTNVLDISGYGQSYTATSYVLAGNHSVKVTGVNTGGPGSIAVVIAPASQSQGVALGGAGGDRGYGPTTGGHNGTVTLTFTSKSVGQIKVGGVWKPITNTYVKVNGIWKLVTSVYTKVAGAWKEVKPSTPPDITTTRSTTYFGGGYTQP